MKPENSSASANQSLATRMELWPNDDLLLSQNIRDIIAGDFPHVLRVFDWPELRALFGSIDDTATTARKRRQRIAFRAVALAGLGAVLSAALPLLDLLGSDITRWAFLGSALLSVGGFCWTVLLAFSSPDKAKWLENRLRTERLRQFYFQFMISDPTLAVRAMHDDAALVEWRSRQAEALTLFRSWLDRPMAAELTAVIEDVNDRRVWQRRQWEKSAPAPETGDDLDTYFQLLRRQRIGIQLHYVREKLAPGSGSPETRLKVVQLTSHICAAMTLTLLSAAAIALFADGSSTGLVFIAMTSGAALLGAVAMVFKVMADGLQLKSDVARYHWYRDAVKDIDARFNDPDGANRLALLRRLEEVSYREMREFLDVHDKAGFSLA